MPAAMAALAPEPRVQRCTLASWRVALDDGAATTLHVARFHRDAFRARAIALDRPERLATWCRSSGIAHALVGGFFVRPGGTPLGELRLGGRRLRSTPFDAPWDELRSCVQIEGEAFRVAPRWALGPEPGGDVIQAGPVLVRGGASRILNGADPEGFSAGARQFDSDITAGRYPRAALGIASDEVLAVACDGRGPEDAGLTLGELADALLDLGAEDAINLDGGGSASLVFAGRLRNRPREEHGIPLAGGRPIATAIAFEPV